MTLCKRRYSYIWKIRVTSSTFSISGTSCGILAQYRKGRGSTCHCSPTEVNVEYKYKSWHLNQKMNKCTNHESLVFHLKSLLRITLQLLNEFFLSIDQPLNVDKHKTDCWNLEVPVLHVEHHPLGQRLRSAVDQQGVDFWKGQPG